MSSKHQTPIRLIRPASRETDNILAAHLKDLEENGFIVSQSHHGQDPSWKYTSGSYEDRLSELSEALQDKNTSNLLCARGGYGVSDLLAGLPWSKLRQISPKTIVGFSDISALHSAVYAILGWPSIHGPMPSMDYWRIGSQDVSTLKGLLKGDIETGDIGLANSSNASISGQLFGGCLSVLTCLIGTPYFPTSLENHIIFLEDIGESPPKIQRYLNQWLHSDALKNARAIVFGAFVNCGDPRELEIVFNRLSDISGIPVMYSKDFGHQEFNMPLPIGGTAEINGNKLSWKIQKQEKMV